MSDTDSERRRRQRAEERGQAEHSGGPVRASDFFAKERGHLPVLRNELLDLIEFGLKLHRRRRWYWRWWMRVHLTFARLFQPRVVVVEVEKAPAPDNNGPKPLIWTPPFP